MLTNLVFIHESRSMKKQLVYLVLILTACTGGSSEKLSQERKSSFSGENLIQYVDPYIGTGIGDMGDVLLLPFTGPLEEHYTRRNIPQAGPMTTGPISIWNFQVPLA